MSGFSSLGSSSGIRDDQPLSYPADAATIAVSVFAHGKREDCLVLSPGAGPQVPNATPASTFYAGSAYAPSSVLAPNNTPANTQGGDSLASPPQSFIDPRGKQTRHRFATQKSFGDLTADLQTERLTTALEAMVTANPDLVREEVGGVLENSHWQEAIEEDLMHSLVRLANLAEDDHKVDPSKTAKEHYHSRLARLLNTTSIPVDLGLLEQVQ